MFQFLISFVFSAEKKFKKILKKLDEPTDHLHVVNGELRCHVCGNSEFQSQEEALDHIKREHNGDDDFEGSDSDASVRNDESTDETDDSSGVDSSEAESSGDDDKYSDSDDHVVSSKKAKPSSSEPQEVKNGREILTECVEHFRGDCVTTKTLKWTQQL